MMNPVYLAKNFTHLKPKRVYRTEGQNRNILLPTIRIKYFVVNLYNLGQQKGNELGL